MHASSKNTRTCCLIMCIVQKHMFPNNSVAKFKWHLMSCNNSIVFIVIYTSLYNIRTPNLNYYWSWSVWFTLWEIQKHSEGPFKCYGHNSFGIYWGLHVNLLLMSSANLSEMISRNLSISRLRSFAFESWYFSEFREMEAVVCVMESVDVEMAESKNKHFTNFY